MRARVGDHLHKGPYDPSIMEMSDLKLGITYRYVVEKKKKEMEKEQRKNQEWYDAFNTFFRNLYAFTNPKAYNQVMESAKLKEHESEVSEEEFDDVLGPMIDSMPDAVIEVEETDETLNIVPEADPEMQDFITGFKGYQGMKKRG